MISSAYVFIEGLQDEPVICGQFELNSAEQVGRFVYGRSYLERKEAFALDPLHLPLNDSTYTCLGNKGVFGVLSDAGADAWGRKLIAQLHTTKPKNELEYLIAGASMGVGALSFSLSRSAAKTKRSQNSLADIALLLQGKNAILAAERVSDAVKQAFIYGSSMGGARPKTLLSDAGQEYLVKFNKSDDLFNTARVEHATMRMLGELEGVHVAETQVATQDGSSGEDLLLVKRFDRNNERVSHHFISANSLLQQGTLTGQSLRTWYSYGQLAEFLRRYSARAEDAIELYKRLAFNVMIGNTDDHARNHALIYPLHQPHGWHLSPAYDVLPISNSGQHSLGIGDDGRIGNRQNLLSQAKRFGLKPFKAAKAIAPVLEKGNLVILESTSPVGATEKLSGWLADARPDLTFPQQAGNDADIQVAHCPERVLPGKVVEELVTNSRIIGGMTDKANEMAIELYKTFVEGQCITTDARTAEMAKLTENSFRDVNIAFANELSLICDELKINVWELIKLANLHPRVNILQPGAGVGGHCIAVDPWFIVDSAPEQAKIIKLAREVNNYKPQWVVDKVKAAITDVQSSNPSKRLSDIRVACLGMAFKPNIDDLRESPALQIVKEIAKIGCKVLAIEPNIEQLPSSINSQNVALLDLHQGTEEADVVCVLVKHKEFEQLKAIGSHQYVIDVVGLV